MRRSVRERPLNRIETAGPRHPRDRHTHRQESVPPAPVPSRLPIGAQTETLRDARRSQSRTRRKASSACTPLFDSARRSTARHDKTRAHVLLTTHQKFVIPIAEAQVISGNVSHRHNVSRTVGQPVGFQYDVHILVEALLARLGGNSIFGHGYFLTARRAVATVGAEYTSLNA